MQIFRPTSLDEAVEVRAAHPEALLLAGGTDVMVDINLKHSRPRAVLSLRRVPELTAMDEAFIGSGVTYSRLVDSHHPALAQAARTVGSPQIRARGTIGGNLGTASPAGDALPFLVAADAEVVLASAESRRAVSIHDFLLGPKINALGSDELIVGVGLDPDLPRRQEFAKVGTRQSMVIAVASVCIIRGPDNTTRVAIGSVGPTVMRVPRAETVASKPVVNLDQFQQAVSSESRPVTDHRATEEYRRHAVGVIARRALARIVDR